MATCSVFDLAAIRAGFEDAGVGTHFIPIIWKYILQNPGAQAHEVPSLPSAAYPLLRSKFRSVTSSVDSVTNSADQVTTKLLIKLQKKHPPLSMDVNSAVWSHELENNRLRFYLDIQFKLSGGFVEAVIMRYDSRLGKYAGKPRLGGPRSTLCLSSQVGCKMGCKFCATGSMGFKSNLTSGEIVEQLVHASRVCSIRNVVFMVYQSYEQLGMGEPLNNYSAVVEAIRVMTGSPFRLSPKRITVSTVGIIFAIKKLCNDLPNVNLAISLHAPDQEIRCQIMPAARAFPLEKLMGALHAYQKVGQQKILIEYIMLNGINDEEKHAHQLGELLASLEVVVNLIPFNPIGTLSQYRTSTEEAVVKFQKILRGYYNIRTTVRKQMGQDISGACGQLVVNRSERKEKMTASVITDIEDLHI